jgi:adenosylhomocysteine nucleosidase
MSAIRFGIVVAMEREIAPLIKGWRIYLGNRQKFFEHEEAMVVSGGLGPVAAQDAAEALIARRSPEILVSAGFGGALVRGRNAGDVFVPAEVVDAASGGRFKTLSGSGVLVSSNEVLTGETKRDYATRFGADVVDMEAATVARVAQQHGCKFLAVKAISDELDFDMPRMDRFISPDGEFHTLRFALHTALHPSLWSSARKLAGNSQRASLRLSAALDHLINGKDPSTLESVPARLTREVVR